ncbi:MAG: ATP-dependent protease ATPase subunit HslU [Candidatus Sumerlaeia bacterium]
MDRATVTEDQIEELTPRQIVRELDKYIVGQAEAKRVVAIALRNRTRRRRVDAAMQEEIYPKNIIMIGPTGVGKTEIARRLARLVGAPFVKVEASKYTEVGYVGRDVESMVRDLVETAVNMHRERMAAQVRPQAESRARTRLLDLLTQPSTGGRRRFIGGFGSHDATMVDEEGEEGSSRDMLTKLLDEGRIENREVEFEISAKPGVEGMFGMIGIDEQMMGNVRDMMEKVMPQKRRMTRMTVAEARKVLIDEEIEQMLDKDKIQREAIGAAEQYGIIFVDEIDKIAGRQAGAGPDVSREGVQRDILPIVEGCTVFTKYGAIKTDHILFIAAGAFHSTKPSDLIPELQGRFPLRVELDSLTTEDMRRILVEPENSLIKQYIALMATDGVELEFKDEAIDELAHAASEVNRMTENIGARRLHSVIERVLEPVSFDAPDQVQGAFTIDRAYVKDRLAEVMKDQDLSRFIL